MSARPVRVAVASAGALGNAFIRLLQEYASTSRRSPRTELVRVLQRHPPRVRLPRLDRDLVTTRLGEFLASPSDVVVDATASLKWSEELALAALSSRRRYVTANRALIARCGPDLVELAQHHGGAFDFGAALGGCLPTVGLLRDGALGAGIRSVRAFFDIAGTSLAGAIQAASEGLAILAWLGFGADPRRLVIRRPAADATVQCLEAMAATVGGSLTGLAEVVETPGGLVASVEPVVLPSPTGGEQVIVIESRATGRVSLHGQADGVTATAALLYADVIAGATPIPPPNPQRQVATDPRVHQWLVLAPSAAHEVVASYCRAHELEQSEIGGQRTRADRLLGVRAPSAAIAELRSRLAARQLRMDAVRWLTSS